MKTIDFHSHLLSKELAFHRPYDKLAISLFAKKLGSSSKELIQNKYIGFEDTYVRNINNSTYVDKSVILPVDGIVDSFGKEISKDNTVCSSNDDILSFHSKYPDISIPFFSVNPNRLDALDLIDQYVASGFKGAKFLQNYWNIDLSDAKYIPYFEKLKHYNLPVIIHSGGEHAVSSNPLYESIDVAKLPIEIGCNVVLAHFGLNMIMNQSFKTIHHNFSFDSSTFGDDYFKTISFLENHDNVYADLSAIIAFFRSKVLKDLAENQSQIHDKLLFGTDFPVPFSILFSHHSLSLNKRLELEKIQNPLDRYVAFFLQYFNEDHQIFHNWKKLLPLEA